MKLGSRSLALVLALVVCAGAIAPHLHALRENLSAESTLELTGACDGLPASHLHSARLVQQHPCIACARQHSISAPRDRSEGVALIVTAAPITPVPALLRNTAITFALLRAPPV